MLTPETILQNRYRIIRQLGQGGMGAVYEAIDERLDTTVALKETFFADERLRKQFEREARLLARLHHPALPRVSDHFSEGDGQFLVMQYIAGEDLAEMVSRRRGAFPPNQVLTWAEQLLDALDYLHTQEPQIVHRDIKPQNLKTTSRGQIILLDFGLAKGQVGEVSRVTTSGSIFGYTPNYAPLEQIQGLGTDARSDLYSLAATVYHLMTGIKPPDALSRAAALVNGQPDPLQNAHAANSAVDPNVAAVLDKAMAQNRDQRYSSAAEMQKALGQADEAATLTGRGEAATVLFPPQGTTVSASTQVPGNQTSAKLPTKLTGETTVARVEKKSTRRLSPAAIAAGALVLLVCAVGFYALQQRKRGVQITQESAVPVNSPAASPSPSAPAEANANSGKATAHQEESAAKVEKQTTKTERAKNSQKRTPAKTDGNNDETDNESGRADKNKDEPDVPDPDVPTPPGRQPGVRRVVGGVTIRTLPDGSQIVRTPQGDRILITPDGKRRFLRPGERFRRNQTP
ncbi:MAG TPA: serine/threonine-protein kinase [Pyrinomonadaceae bacterium]